MNRPECYRKYNSLQKRDNEFTLDRYLNLILWKKNPKVLDLGSGDGTTTIEILEPRLPRDYMKLIGSDLEQNMVEYANKFSNKSKIGFVQFDISADQILTEKFDHIFSFFAIHWVKDLRKGFQNIYNLLSPSGSMLINLVLTHPYHNFLKSFFDHPKWGLYYGGPLPPIIRGPKPESLLRVYLESTGFVDCEIKIEEREFVYSNLTECLKSYLSLDPIISKLDDDLRLEYLVDCMTMFQEELKDFEDANGEIRVIYNLLIVFATNPE